MGDNPNLVRLVTGYLPPEPYTAPLQYSGPMNACECISGLYEINVQLDQFNAAVREIGVMKLRTNHLIGHFPSGSHFILALMDKDGMCV